MGPERGKGNAMSDDPSPQAARAERSPGMKLLLAALVGFVLMVPLMLVYALVWDRQSQSQTAQEAINAGWGGPQVIAGPVVVVPFRTTQEQTEQVDGRSVVRTVEVEKLLYISPVDNRVETKVSPQERTKSIYRSVLYEAQVSGKARFALPVDLPRFGVTREPDDREGARTLLQGVLRTYQELEGQPLREVFLHARSEISDEEFEGYADACPAGVKLVGIRVRTEWGGTKLFRPGTRPVLRGTFRRVGRRAGYLWASGFKPRLGTYDGWETPVPLRIDVQHGHADLDQVARDIFALTKLNYNACRLGDSEPVTLSNAVGEILVSNRGLTKPQSRFRFYV